MKSTRGTDTKNRSPFRRARPRKHVKIIFAEYANTTEKLNVAVKKKNDVAEIKDPEVKVVNWKMMNKNGQNSQQRKRNKTILRGRGCRLHKGLAPRRGKGRTAHGRRG